MNHISRTSIKREMQLKRKNALKFIKIEKFKRHINWLKGMRKNNPHAIQGLIDIYEGKILDIEKSIITIKK